MFQNCFPTDEYPLMEHQKLGATALMNFATDSQFGGGLLADDMGLGKTSNLFDLLT